MALVLPSVEDQYKKFPQLDRSDVLELQEWQKTQPHLPKITELESIIFLHACKYDIEKAKKCMDMYFTVRTHVPEFFSNRDVFGADFVGRINVSGVALLPGLTKDGYRVIFCKMIDPDPNKFIYVDTVKVYTMVLDYLLARDGICAGYAMVIDMDGSTFSHMTKVSIVAMRKFLFYVQEALPICLREFHFINIPSFMDKILAMMRPFMSKELMNVMYTHKTLDTFLDKCIPKEIMPEEYGGLAGKANDNIAKMYNELQSNAEFFINDENTKRVNEKLRPGKSKTDRDLFGFFLTMFSSSKEAN